MIPEYKASSHLVSQTIVFPFNGTEENQRNHLSPPPTFPLLVLPIALTWYRVRQK
jgi:hypothetical protein